MESRKFFLQASENSILEIEFKPANALYWSATYYNVNSWDEATVYNEFLDDLTDQMQEDPHFIIETLYDQTISNYLTDRVNKAFDDPTYYDPTITTVIDPVVNNYANTRIINAITPGSCGQVIDLVAKTLSKLSRHPEEYKALQAVLHDWMSYQGKMLDDFSNEQLMTFEKHMTNAENIFSNKEEAPKLFKKVLQDNIQ